MKFSDAQVEAARIREAFDGDDVPLKNRTLRKAADAIRKLEAENAGLREALEIVTHYMLAAGVNVERDYPEIPAALEKKP